MDFEKRSKTDLYGSSDYKPEWVYTVGDDMPQFREVDIESIGEDKTPVTIIQLTDLHFNLMNEQDLEEKNPTLMSTYEKRWWLSGGEGENFAQKALEYADKEADKTVITGDVMDYLSNGCAQMLQSVIWDKYPDMLVTTGNHEWCQQMEGEIAETLTFQERRERLEKIWKHNLYYTREIVKDKVMLILLENGVSGFWDCQIEPLKADIALAREKGYTVLLFMHIPISTNCPNDIVKPIGPGGPVNFNIDGVVGGSGSTGATKEVYDIIINNADVIKGIFTGHFHADYYTEVKAKTIDGTAMIIPQYVLTLMCICKTGSLLKITVK